MNRVEAEASRCNLCGTVVASDQPARWTKDGFDVVECLSCGLLFRRAMPAPGELREIYALRYFRRPPRERDASGYLDYLGDEEIHRIAARRRLALLSRHMPPGRLLDVGCASGFFLEEARAAGWTVHGVDVSPDMTSVARGLGLEVDTCSFQEATDLAPGSFDCVTMWDYIEHSCDPAADLRKGRSLLRRGGMLAASTGDAGAPFARLSGRRWHLLTPRHHNFFFTRSHLARMLEDAGLQVLSMRAEPRYATPRYLVYKMTLLAPESRTLQLVRRWLDRVGIGERMVAVNLFDVVQALALRP